MSDMPEGAVGSHEPERQPFVPFLVADRPASLRILRGIPLESYEGPLGLMTHANTSENFREMFSAWPCAPAICEGSCTKLCESHADNVIKMCDSGVFTKRGCPMSYPELFELYDEMGVDYGIMIDHIRDPEQTLESAAEALDTYRDKERPFELVGVAQGTSVSEYRECYDKLKQMGYGCVAVGGLLKKRSNTSHYTYVRSNRFLRAVLKAIREGYPDDWLFALGCYNPNRHLMFEQLDLFGADYKGWIFNYTPREDLDRGYARISRYMQVRHFLSREVFESSLYLNGERELIERSQGTGETTIIISCGSKKIWDTDPDAGPTPASEAYVGTFFRRNKQYAQKFGDRWAILSGKHGLLLPDDVVKSNYDVRFAYGQGEVNTRDIRDTIVGEGLIESDQVVVLGGQEYGKAIEEAYAGTGISVSRPLERYKKIGKMLQAVIHAIESGRPLESHSGTIKCSEKR